jgi:hypothetical protein
MRISDGASGTDQVGFVVARVANGDPTNALYWRRLSVSSNAFSVSFHRMYWPPIPPGHSSWRSLLNEATISMGRTDSTSSTIATAGSSMGAKMRSRTVKAAWL